MGKRSRGKEVVVAKAAGGVPAKSNGDAPRAQDLAEQRLWFQAYSATFTGPEDSDEDRQKLIVATAALMSGFNSADTVEMMMAAQMTTLNNIAMECGRRAMLPDQPLPGYEVNLKYMMKATAAFVQHLEALNQYRGKGQQKVTVENVSVQAGGQAVVGYVEAPKPQEANNTTPQTASLPDVAANPKPRKKRLKRGGENGATS